MKRESVGSFQKIRTIEQNGRATRGGEDESN